MHKAHAHAYQAPEEGEDGDPDGGGYPFEEEVGGDFAIGLMSIHGCAHCHLTEMRVEMGEAKTHAAI